MNIGVMSQNFVPPKLKKIDFRLPQPLIYSMKKKKVRRKVLQKETRKLSLKNHNKNVSCQTDSSESSEVSSASSSKKNCRSSKSGKSTEKNAVNNVECIPLSVKLDRDPNIYSSSIYHYCTPLRRKENYNNLKEADGSQCKKITTGPLNDHCMAVAIPGMSNNEKSSEFNHVKGGGSSRHSILLSDNDSDSVLGSGDALSKVSDCKDREDRESVHSSSSKILLESSFLTEDLSSLIVPSNPDKKMFNILDEIKASKNATPFRSSMLHRRFNRVVENDLANECNYSDFYMRVKKRVMGLQVSNGQIVDKEKKCDSNEEASREDGQELCVDDVDEDKENIDENASDSTKYISLYERVKRRTIIPDSEESINDTCSPVPNVNIDNPVKLVNSDSSESADSEKKQKSMSIRESSPSSLDSDSKSSNFASQREGSLKSSVCRRPRFKNRCVISDSDDSNRYESPKRTTVDVVEPSDSDSSAKEILYDKCHVEGIVNGCDVGRHEEIQYSEERFRFKKTLRFSNNFEQNSRSSDLFRRVTKKALILESSDSVDKSENIHDKCDVQKLSEVNLQFKPGFSTLSQSKHEDIKKWLTTIPCNPETNTSSVFDLKAHTSQSLSTDKGDDNISLTEMEKVLDELYGKNWKDKKKSETKLVPKKKESQIICERLTDSDDSSTPPLPASTPSKKKLYNHVIRINTPEENNCVTPARGKNIFTPLTSTGKKGIKTSATPRTAGPKCKREKECLTSGAFSSPVLTFLASLSVGHQSARCHPEAKYFVKNFKSKKIDLAKKLFQIFNKDVFSSKLPDDLPIIWNNRLRKTAGYCYNRRVKNSAGGFTRTSRVELSSKIVDNAGRLRDTLVHELCHAATWIISEVTGGHGPAWKRWTNKAMAAFPELPPVSRCHNYDIVTKYKYQCTVCNYSIGRHSKSLDIQRKCCGICGGTFELLLNAKDEGGKPVPKTPRTLNAFALFVKENYGATKKTQENLKHKDVMRLLSEKFASTKITFANNEKEN